MKKVRLVGPEYDLYSAVNQELVAKGLRLGVLTQDELRALCASIVRHTNRLNLVLKTVKQTKH